jgi:cytochrome c556
MTSSIRRGTLGAVLAIALIGTIGSAAAVDSDAVLKERQATMKEQGKDLGRIKDFVEGKGDQAGAQAGAKDLTETTRKIPDLFPAGTDKASPDGDFRPKPAIWTDWDKFLDAQKMAAAKADALFAAVKTGDKAAIQAAFADLGKNGCGNCHKNFREKLKN